MSNSTNRSLIIVSKIIFFYSLFYVVMKIIAIFGDAWLVPNLILSIPYIIFAAIGGWMLKNEKYYWAYAIAGVLVISAIRYFEQEWMLQLHNYFS